MKTISKYFSQVKGMEGKTYRINGSTVDETLRHITMSSGEDEPEEIIIQTSVRTRRLTTVEEADKFIRSAILVPKDDLAVAQPKPVMPALEQVLPEAERIGLNKLEDILMNALDNIEKDDKYVKKAKEINNTARNIMEIKKFRLKALSMAINASKAGRKKREDEAEAEEFSNTEQP